MTKEKTVAIIDDRKTNRERHSDYLRDKGFEPRIISDHLGSVDVLLQLVRHAKATYALCDHRLNEGDFATFFGAEAVAAFYDSHIISPVLHTAFQRNYLETSIRRYRRKIPMLVHYEELNADTLEAALLCSHREVVERIVPPSRQPFQTLMSVTDLVKQGMEMVVRVVIAQWNPTTEVGFPLTMLPTLMQNEVQRGTFLRADVNVDAPRPEDIYFENFSFPHPDDIRRLKSESDYT